LLPDQQPFPKQESTTSGVPNFRITVPPGNCTTPTHVDNRPTSLFSSTTNDRTETARILTFLLDERSEF
jgi:hypothetical protein